MTVTACGKVILLGEHAVVYGRPSLAAGIESGAEAMCEATQRAGVVVAIAPWNVEVTPETDSDLGRALRDLIAVMTAGQPLGNAAVSVRAKLNLPGGGGLGSSAALGVVIARALAVPLLSRELSLDETLAAALAWERVFHGNPSGIDHTMAARGGVGVFSRVDGLMPIQFETNLRLLIADTGERSPTRDMVASVARIHARRPDAIEKTFDAIAALVRNGALALTAGDEKSLGQLFDLNQALLSSLLLSTERTEDLCHAARSAGAAGAKLTGGGGGGCVIALPGGNEAKILEAWRQMGAPAFVAEIASQPAV